MLDTFLWARFKLFGELKTLIRLVVVLAVVALAGWFFFPRQPAAPIVAQAEAPVTVAAVEPPAPPAEIQPDLSKLPPIDFEALRLRFGAPDAETTTAWDNPRPAFVTRTMTFGKHRLKVVMMANEGPGAPPPYKSWVLVGLVDPVTGSALSADEVQSRLNSPKPDKTKPGTRTPSLQASR